jgi:hypothetical protein
MLHYVLSDSISFISNEFRMISRNCFCISRKPNPMMDLIFPPAEYAEDQKNASEILYFHGVLKGIQTGSIVGFGLGSLIGLVRKQPVIANAVKSSAVGLCLGSMIVPAMVYAKMKDKELIEFQDRAWRIQRNQSQNVF